MTANENGGPGHKTIGLLGGTTPESTSAYYLRLTHEYTRRFGDQAFPRILIYSVVFQRLVDLVEAGRWDRVADELVTAFETLRRAGADFGLITANTLHLVLDEVAARTSLPLLSIVEVTVAEILRHELSRVALLGTNPTMEAPLYPDALARRGVETLVPEKVDRRAIHRIIYDELSRGTIRDESRQKLLRIIGDLRERGAEGVILGCTELPMLVRPGEVDLPLIDTLEIHADRALSMAVGETGV